MRRLAGLLLVGCAAAPPPPQPPPASPASPPAVVSACPSDPAAEVVEILDFEGSCTPPPGEDPTAEVDISDAGAAYAPRPAVPAEYYTTVLQVQPSTLGAARVRSRLVFDAGDLRNVLTTVPDCALLRLAGPMKNSSGSMGLGWAVRLRDPAGQVCQGYLSQTVLAPPSVPP